MYDSKRWATSIDEATALDEELERIDAAAGEATAGDWLWPGRLKLGALSLIACESEDVASQAVSMLAATITGRRRWPDSSPGRVDFGSIAIGAHYATSHEFRRRLIMRG